MTAVERVAEFLVWLGRLTRGWSPQVFAALATVFSIVWGSYGKGVWTTGIWAFIVTLACAVLSLLSQIALQRPSYMALADRVERAERQSQEKSGAIEKALEILLRKLADHCSVASNSDRVSVYYFRDEHFVMLARWSIHPDYRRRGRPRYPAKQGAIGEAWVRGSAVMSLPDTRRQWERSLVTRHGFSAEAAHGLTMHCRSIAALRLESDHRPTGVIVFESDEGERASQETLDTAESSKLFETLTELVGAVADLTPVVERETEEQAQPLRESPPWKPVDRSDP